MDRLKELALKMPDHIVIEKCLWVGRNRVEIEHMNNDLNQPLDFLKAFERMNTILELKG